MYYRRTRFNQRLKQISDNINISAKDFIQPIFIGPSAIDNEISSVYTLQTAKQQIAKDLQNNIDKFLLFILPNQKCEHHEVLQNESFKQILHIISDIKREFNDSITLMTDVCFCLLTKHSECAIIENGIAQDTKTSYELSKIGLAYIEAGADALANSDMMDTSTRIIREYLIKHNHNHTNIISYIKFQSKMYSVFREIADTSVDHNYRHQYQLDVRNSSYAMKKVKNDVKYADMLIIKPSHMLDITYQAKKYAPLISYQVTGECMEIQLMHNKRINTRHALYMEKWLSMKRAGASSIISYAARDAHNIISKG